MTFATVIPLNTYWMDLRVASEHVGVDFPDVVSAAARGEMYTEDNRRGRPGVCMVRMLEVEAWADRRAS